MPNVEVTGLDNGYLVTHTVLNYLNKMHAPPYSIDELSLANDMAAALAQSLARVPGEEKPDPADDP